jgi:phosphopantothenoylcysteine synthetase/decarboxylase
MEGAQPPLSLVVCAAPLAARAAGVAGALATGGGYDVTVLGTPAARAWLDAESVARATGRSPVFDFTRPPSEPRRRPRPMTVVICPATFNTLNKSAAGISDSHAMAVINEALADPGRSLIVVPFVSEGLWEHPAWQPTLDRLSAHGAMFVNPVDGSDEARPLESGTGPAIAEAFDPDWLLERLPGP